MEKKLKDAQQAQTSLENVLTEDKTPVVLDKAISEVMLAILNKRVEHGITVSYTTPAKLSTGGSISKLDALSEPVPGTKVQSVRINLNGNYQTYQGLLNFLKSLQGLPVSIVRLKVQDQSFELAIRIYGNES